MAKVQVLYWQEIPSVVEARDEQGVAKQQLSERFQQLIDHAAMIRKLAGTDAYLDHWNKGEVSERSGDAKTAAAELAGELEAQFDSIRSSVVSKARGK